ncbi:O-antigen translocase [Marinilactibacillus kalidii]|uniref:O-antigen translocase n=1 Tax=Marinilactibacillus kalidii TaxID=2820274 RepID=UPI001ABE5571|nr:O-antigen translocase [Marinilactibacillus kalidii]
MNLFKTSFWSGLSTIIKLLAGIVTTKIMAIYIGPSGIGLLGNFNNIIGIFSTFANGAIGVGTTKYISEFERDKDKRSVTLHSLRITIFCSLIIGSIILLFHRSIASLIFGEVIYTAAIIIIGITIIFFGLNTTITAVFNGYKNIKVMTVIGIVGNLISVILAFIITINFGLFGALINASIAQICIFLLNIFAINKLKLIDIKELKGKIDKVLTYNLFKYALMSIVSALFVPTGTLFIRTYIINNFSLNEAGYVQAVWSISSMYLLVITTTLSIYYLPTLSSLKKKSDLRNEILKGYKYLIPVAILSGVTILLSRNLIINILYTPDFLKMKEYFVFQIVGDTFKIASWILAYLMVAKAMTKLYIITEILFAVIYLTLAILFMNIFGSIGVTYAYATNYLLYLLTMLYLFRKTIFRKYLI